MRKGFAVGLAASVALVSPSAASACDSYLGYLFMRSYMQRTIGGGVQIQPGTDGQDTYAITTVDVGFPFGQGRRGMVKPQLGLCVGDGTEVVFGGGGAYQLWTNPESRLAVDGQVAFTAYSFDGGSEQVVPIGAIARLDNASGNASLLFGAGVAVAHYSVDAPGFSDSGSDTDPFASIGALFGRDDLRFQAGLLIRKGDYDTDIALNGAVAVPWD